MPIIQHLGTAIDSGGSGGGGGGIVTTNLVLHLDAGNSSSYSGSGTTWTDLSGQGNHATLVNGVGYSSSDGGYLTFDGGDDYVSETSGLSDSFLQANWTISFWVKINTLSTSTAGTLDKILLHHGSSSSRNGLHFVQRNSRFHFGLYGDDLEGSATLSTGTWYNVVYTLNNTSYAKQIYINGSLDNSNTGGGAYTGTGTNTKIGGKVLSFGMHIYGNIAKVIAYSSVLSATEILHNYNIDKSTYGH